MTLPGTADLGWILLALAFGGISKGLTGLGLPLFTVPVLAGVFGVERAVIIMVIPSMLLNHYAAWVHRDGAHELPEVRRILMGALPGVALGASILQRASDRFLSTSLAIWILAYVLLRLLHPHFRIGAPSRQRWSALVGASAGALQAATGISAPIIAAYMDAIGLKPRAYVFAVSICFGGFATGHFLVLLATGVYRAEMFWQSVAAMVPALACVPVGIWARRFISRSWFDTIIRLTLVTMAARLLYEAWLGSA